VTASVSAVPEFKGAEVREAGVRVVRVRVRVVRVAAVRVVAVAGEDGAEAAWAVV